MIIPNAKGAGDVNTTCAELPNGVDMGNGVWIAVEAGMIKVGHLGIRVSDSGFVSENDMATVRDEDVDGSIGRNVYKILVVDSPTF